MARSERLYVGFNEKTLGALHIRAAAEDRTVPSVVRRLVAYALLHMPHQWTPPPNGERQ